jgi:secondary thiamine-phosphate synthase enzyme
MVTRLIVATQQREQFIDVTATVTEALAQSGARSGVVTLFVPHTTAAITINENADPDVTADMLKGLSEIVPRAASFYRHAEGNSDAHIKASLLGSSMQLLVEDGKLQLGTWQGVYLAEFDGPRERRLWVKFASD